MSKRIRRGAQQQTYYIKELIVLFVVVIGLIFAANTTGITDQAEPGLADALHNATLDMGVWVVVGLGVLLLVITKVAGKPAGAPAGTGLYRLIQGVIWLAVLAGFVWWGWMQ
jgi:hypothetical protein